VNDRKRELIAEKLMDIGNYGVSILAFFQFVAEKTNWNIVFFAISFGYSVSLSSMGFLIEA